MKNWKMLMLFAAIAMVGTSAFAQGTAAGGGGGVAWGALAAAFAIGIAAAGGAIGQSRGIAAACEGIARNPGAAGAIRLVMIIGLALIESLVIYALIIAFMIRTL